MSLILDNLCHPGSGCDHGKSLRFVRRRVSALYSHETLPGSSEQQVTNVNNNFPP